MVSRRMMRPASAEIAATNAAFVAALARGDATAAAAAYAQDARLLPPSAEPMEGRDAIMAFWRAGLDAGIVRAEIEPLELRTDGRFAYELGRYELWLQPTDNGTVVDRGNYLLVHARQEDGTWRRAVEMFNPDAPASPAHTLGDEGQAMPCNGFATSRSNSLPNS